MHAIEYKDKLRNSVTERELAKELRKLPEEERFAFIVEMLEVKEPVAHELANACLRRHDLLTRFLEVGLARVKDLSRVRDWLEALMPRLGYRGLCRVLRENLQSYPFAVGSSLYFMLGFLDRKDPSAVAALIDLWEAAKNQEGAILSGHRPALEDAFRRLQA